MNACLVTVHFNPAGFHRPVENLQRFIDWASAQGVPFHWARLVFDHLPEVPGTPEADLTIHGGPEHVLFQKESLLNRLVEALPDEIDTVIYLDADVILQSPDWLARMERSLQASPFVQPFSRCTWLDDYGRPAASRLATFSAAAQGMPQLWDPRRYHPGFGFAARRTLWTEGPGAYPSVVLGSGDSVMIGALMGFHQPAVGHFRWLNEPSLAAAYAYSVALRRWFGRSPIVSTPGDVVHLWHGSRDDRGYTERFALLEDHDPAQDLEIDPDRGIVRWTADAMERKAAMVQAVADYFPTRFEDGRPAVTGSAMAERPN